MLASGLETYALVLGGCSDGLHHSPAHDTCAGRTSSEVAVSVGDGFFWEHGDDFGSSVKQAHLGSPFVLPDDDDGLN